MIRRNPCRIKGAGQEKSPERPVLTIRQVFALAAAIEPRYRALVLLAVFASLRWGELAALRRGHIDLASGTLRVALSVVELVDGSLVTGPPKSEAGKRLVTLPPFLLPEIETHLDQFTAPDNDSLVFVGPKNGPLRRSNFSGIWRSATESAGLTSFHFHDLRHTGNHIAAATGASLRELMGRMGHSTTRAALIYQHRTTERDRLIAAAMSEIVETELDEIEAETTTSLMRGEKNRDHACYQALRGGAGDENRTRTISLGSGAITAASGVDLRTPVAASGRGCPLITLLNGPLMARPCCVGVRSRSQLARCADRGCPPGHGTNCTLTAPRVSAGSRRSTSLEDR